MKTLSIVIPAYNEEKTLGDILKKVIEVKLVTDFSKEIIIVNDGSTDNTLEIAEQFAKLNANVIVIKNPKNMGKSQSVRNGILRSTGDYVVIQDADLEYEPQDFADMLSRAIENNYDVVYGNRFGRQNKIIYLENYIGNRVLSFISNIFTYPRIGVWIDDMETCYKLIKGDIARELALGLTAISNFGFEPEITAKLSKYKIQNRHLKFGIHPIRYHPRSIEEGKKMKSIKDGIKALKEIFYYNLH